MPVNNGDSLSLFEAVEELLTRWLKERRELLGKYTELAVALHGDITDSTLSERQKSLCQLLVDYVSSGHFEVYHRLINEAESFDDGSCVLAEKLMPAIGDTTEVILAYEEKYSGAPEGRSKVKRDLSALGEMLESRFALEDKLIAGLHNRHRRQISDLTPGADVAGR